MEEFWLLGYRRGNGRLNNLVGNYTKRFESFRYSKTMFNMVVFSVLSWVPNRIVLLSCVVFVVFIFMSANLLYIILRMNA